MNKKFYLVCHLRNEYFYYLDTIPTTENNILSCWCRIKNSKIKVNKLLVDFCIYHDKKWSSENSSTIYAYEVQKS